MDLDTTNSGTVFTIRTSRTGEREFQLSRVNVFLGANGTGKTKILQELKAQAETFLPGFQPVNIEGGRAVKMYDSLELTAQNFNQFKTSDDILKRFRGHRGSTLTSRIFFGLKALEQMGIDAKIAHSDAVVRWEEMGCDKDTRPGLPDEPMLRVFETFNDIFPSITLQYKPHNRRLVCHKQGSAYGPTGLSDGEKQVFSILVDIIELTDSKSVLFIDEPELNLNPGLANRLWSSIEALLPEAVFIYATHSVSFAMRGTVKHLVVMSNHNENIQEIAELGELSHDDQAELLGNIPGLLAQGNTLVVEGHDESFDSIFYHWLLEGIDFSPTAVGGSEDVVAITTREGKWKKITPMVKLAGIVDRDYKSEGRISNIESKGVMVLDHHEAESYLCDPTLLADLSQLLGTSGQPLSIDHITKQVFSFLNAKRLIICARRANDRLTRTIKPSVSSKTLARVSTISDLETIFLTDVADQLAQANETLEQNRIREILREENTQILETIQSQDLAKALILAPGKELLESFTGLVGVVDSNVLARAARRHLVIDNYPHLQTLRNRLFEKLSPST